MSKVPEWIILVVIFVAFAFALRTAGEVFRAVPWLFIGLWAGGCLLAVLFSKMAVLTLRQSQRLRVILMILVTTLSVFIILDATWLRDQFGYQTVQGYGTWIGEDQVDDYGRPYTDSGWHALTFGGRLEIWFLVIAIYGGGVLLPWVTWRACTSLVDRSENAS